MDECILETTPSTLILASTSRYRQSVLSKLHLPFTTASPHVDENPLPGEAPMATAQRLACLKAQAICKPGLNAWVIGSDQVACLNGKVLGKPGNEAQARQQLSAMSGQEVLFHTAVALCDSITGQTECAIDTAHVTFRTLSDGEIDRYLKQDKPFDCAGSFKSEGYGITLLERIRTDDPNALIGLPLILLGNMLRNRGFTVP